VRRISHASCMSRFLDHGEAPRETSKRSQEVSKDSWKLTSHLHAFAKQAKPVFGLKC
jgi:hypothetical protein